MRDKKLRTINKINTYKSKFLEKVAENNAIRNEVAFYNINRLYYTALIAIPVELAHIIIFWSDSSLKTDAELKWRNGIILSHMLLVSIMIFFSFFSYYSRKKKDAELPMNIMTKVAIIAILLFGVSITTIDQLITPNVTPFLVACTITAVIFLMRPFFAAIVYAGTYILYYNALAITQFSGEILLSNRVNGITAIGIGFCLSIILWKGYSINLKQEKHIKQQQLGLEEKNQQLAELNKLKDRLFAIITHDIREPLATMVSLMELLEEDIGDLQSDSSRIIKEVKQQVNQSYAMIDEVLDWFKHNRGLEFNPSNWQLSEIVQEAIYLFQSKANSKNIDIINNINKHIHIYADREMLDLVLRNIVSNAIKFTDSQGVITINGNIDKEKVITTIQDTGIGISPLKMQQIFSGKKIAPELGTRGEKGIGLGLQLCKELVERNGGDIWADSIVGKGSIFYVSVPLNINVKYPQGERGEIV